MKQLLLAIAILFLPFYSFADLPGGGVRWHTGFSVTNTDAFPDYIFFYEREGDTTTIVKNQIYIFEHPGSPSVDWNIAVFAKNKNNGRFTKAVFVGTNNMIDMISIKSVNGDSISTEIHQTPYTGQSNETNAGNLNSNQNNPGDDADDDSNAGHSSTHSIKYLLGGISIAAILILCLVLFIRRKNKK